MTHRYRALSTADYKLTPLDVVSALYDKRSGQTHLIASPVPELLTMMQDSDLSVDELLQRLLMHYDLPADEDHSASIEARLSELVTLGLVEILP